MGEIMNRKFLRYFYLLLIFLIIININIISAEEIDQDSSSFIEQTAIDNDIEEISDNAAGDMNSLETINSNEANDINPAQIEDKLGDSSDSLDSGSVDSASQVKLKRAHLYSTDYVVKSKYLNVQLKDSSKKKIAKEKISLSINGKTLHATTDSNGKAKFKINEAGKTYKVTLRFEGNSIYKASERTFKLRVIANPIYTKFSVPEKGVISNEILKVYLKTKEGKAIANKKVSITIDGKTYNRTTDKNGLANLRLNKKAKLYKVNLKFDGKSNYIRSSSNIKVNVLNCKVLGKTDYGKVYFLNTIGNRSSKVRIAYVVGLHSFEHQIHDSVYKIMKNKIDMKYKYYIYRIVLTKKSGEYSTDRMRGQILAKTYIVPHAKKQKFNLVVDIHSTTGVSYAKTYFIHVPKNQHAPSMKLAKKTISTIKKIEKNSKMVYWSPQSQTSPPYIHLPLIKAGTPTFVFETWTYEKKSQSDKRAKILTTAIDKIFG